MIKKIIVEDKKTTGNFHWLAAKLKRFVRFLICLICAASFLRKISWTTSNINYEQRITECSSTAEVKLQTIGLLTIISAEKGYKDQRVLFLENTLRGINSTAAIELASYKSSCKTSIKNCLETRNINEHSLNIYFDKTQRIWLKKSTFHTLVTDPIYLLIIKPLNFFYISVASFFAAREQGQSFSFFLEIILKLLLCNLLIYLSCKKVGDLFPVPEFNLDNFKERNPEDINQQEFAETILNSLVDLVIYITIGIILINRKSFLMQRTPNWVAFAPFWKWALVKVGLSLILNIRQAVVSQGQAWFQSSLFLFKVTSDIVLELGFLQFLGIAPDSYAKLTASGFIQEIIRNTILLSKLSRENAREKSL